jgi:hypothetical protein
MNNTLVAVFGVSAGVLNTIACYPYLRDIFKGKTKPERATWWVWLSLAITGLFAQLAAGAKWSVLLTLSGTLCVGAIAVLSLKYGYGRFHTRDTISLLITACCVILAFIVHSPLVALLVVVGVDLVGMWLTLQKTWLAPHTETLSAWALSEVATILQLLAVGDYTVDKYIYPLYGVVANGTIVAVIWYRRISIQYEQLDF